MTIVVGPPAPIVTALADLAAATEIKGTAQAGTTVKVYDNGGATPIATGTVAADGTFDVTTAARLPQGAHALTATVFEGDSGTGRAHFVVNGASQGTNQDVYVNAAQLAQTTYQSGPGTDTIWVRAYDGILWGSWSQPFTVTAPIPAQPVLSVTSDNDAERGGAVPLSELVSISDPEQAGFQTLELWDSNGNPGTGQLLVNGMPQTGGHEIDVAPADVAGTVFNVGTLAVPTRSGRDCCKATGSSLHGRASSSLRRRPACRRSR
jgi:hypothetical protein